MPRLDAGRVATWRAFTGAATALHRKVEAGLIEDYDLPLAWFETLAALQAAGGSLRVGELCEILHELPSSLSRRARPSSPPRSRAEAGRKSRIPRNGPVAGGLA